MAEAYIYLMKNGFSTGIIVVTEGFGVLANYAGSSGRLAVKGA